MQTIIKKTEELKASEYNPRLMSDKDFENLKKSLTEFGIVEPIIINKNNQIIGGHQRVKACIDLGIKEMPCVVVDLDSNKEKKLNIALNKINGEWDNAKLTELLHNLDDIELTGFTQDELQYLDDISDFSREDMFEAEDEDLKGELKEERYILTFYFENKDEYEKVHEYFGGTQNHDTKKLIELINKN